MGIVLSIELVVCVLFYWAANSPTLYFICVLLNYTCIAGTYAIFPVSVISVFGLKRGPQVYVQVLIGSFFSSLFNLFATKWIENYLTLFMIGASVTFVSIIVLCFLKEELDVDRLNEKGLLEPMEMPIPAISDKK